MAVLQQRIEFLDCKSSLADNSSQCSLVQCRVVGHDDAICRVRTLKNDVAPTPTVHGES